MANPNNNYVRDLVHRIAYRIWELRKDEVSAIENWDSACEALSLALERDLLSYLPFSKEEERYSERLNEVRRFRNNGLYEQAVMTLRQERLERDLGKNWWEKHPESITQVKNEDEIRLASQIAFRYMQLKDIPIIDKAIAA